MNKLFLLSIIISIFAISGCARQAKIIIDPKGVDMEAYHADLADCQHIADQVESKVAEGIVGGAVIGAIFGGIIGDHQTAIETAQIGAMSGGLSAGGAEVHERDRIIKNCLRGRGYPVLN